MQKNVASQKIGAQLVSASDGSAFTGSVTVSVTGDAGTQATGSVGSGACTHEGNGYHTYAPAQAETNYDLIAFTFTGTGAIPVTVQVFTRWNANTTHNAGTAITSSSGRQEVNVSHWLGTAAATPTVAGVPEVDVTHANGSAISTSGAVDANVTQVDGASLGTHTAGYFPGDARLNAGSAITASGGIQTVALQSSKTYYLAASGGNDANDGLSRSTAFATYSAAQSAANPGDTIHLIAGTYAAFAISKNGLTIQGDGDSTKVTDASLSTGTINGSSLANVTIRNMWIDTTASSSNALRLSACRNTQIRGCKVTGGSLASIKCFGGTGLTISDCDVTSHADAIAVNGEQGFLVERCNASTDNATTSSGGAGLWAGNSAIGIARGCRFSTSKATASSQLSMAVELDGPDDTTGSGYVLLEDCVLRANCLHPSATGRVACVGGILTDSVIRAGLRNCTLSMSNLGSGTGYQIDARQAGSRIDLWQVEADRSTFNVVGTASGSSNTRTIVDHDLLQKGTTFDQLVVSSNGKVSPADDSITASTFDESTAFPLKSADTGSTQVARKGSEDVTLTDIEAGSGGGGTPPAVLQRTVSPNRILQVKDRGDGTYGVTGEMNVTAGEPKQLWALEFKGTQLPPGQNLFSMSTPTVVGDESDKATIGTTAGETYGAQLTRATYEFRVHSDATATVDDDGNELTTTKIKAKITVQFSASEDGIDVYVPVNVKAAEE